MVFKTLFPYRVNPGIYPARFWVNPEEPFEELTGWLGRSISQHDCAHIFFKCAQKICSQKKSAIRTKCSI